MDYTGSYHDSEMCGSKEHNIFKSIGKLTSYLTLIVTKVIAVYFSPMRTRVTILLYNILEIICY